MTQDKAMTGYPSIDKPWLKYYSEETINASLPECTVYENIKKNNSSHLSDIALDYFGAKVIYEELFDKVEMVKNAFVANGVKKGDSVVMFTSATPELVYAVLALCRIGAVANMINPVFEHGQIKDRINETGANVMLVLDQLYAKIQPITNELCINKIVVISVCDGMRGLTKAIASRKLKKMIIYDNSIISWRAFLAEGRKIDIVADVIYEKDMPLVIVYSSGTTGASKGIVLTNDGINATISHYMNPDFPYNRGDKFLQMIPVWFSTGIVLSLLMPICLGIKVILEPVFSKENFAKGIKKHHPQMTLAPISLWFYVLKCKELRKTDLSDMTYPITGGELVIPRVEERVNSFLESRRCHSRLMKGYGMCELGSTVATDSVKNHKEGATGFPIKGVTVAAFDMANGKELQYGERGEILVNSPAHMKGYYKNKDATDSFFYRDVTGALWGRTGDIGYVAEDGFITIYGRANDTFKAESGEIVYCFDIENEILRNENVAQCEVVGLSMGDYDIPVAHLVLEEMCELSEQEILIEIHENCKENLDVSSLPKGYKFCTSFPVKSSGKRDMELIRQDREGFLLPIGNEVKRVTF